ncbi:lytic transglycosylase domain-containing protein [Devosia limi]|uniref:Transglycosylase SLT domain-containing protein n=1 Tax=Devosia limi DSM 17137 TaxID=1121477 RepID=A0A1M5AR00_9HYPH|nr:lytic transglycosylase domain-containing protein [Devosia limi]SHF32527.1 Transglycosylase SLT domain-containing protein [Devosia limi DSM 17137]
MSKTAALAGLAAILTLSVSGCAISGIKPAPGPATAAIAAMAPTQPGHVPDAAAVPMFSDAALGYVGSPGLDGLIAHYATQYAVPEHLVRRVIVRESNYNSAARNGPYWGLMQISHATAKGMGFKGAAGGLLDPETNLRYAVKYLAGAYVTAGGNEDQAVRFYASGYYYDAKRLGLLEKSGLR